MACLPLAGCAEDAADRQPPPSGLAALGLVAVTTPFMAQGSTLCLPTEQGDDTLCEAPGTEGTRLLLGPYDAPIVGLHVEATWSPEGDATRTLVLTVVCREHGTTDDPPRCEEVEDLVVRGPSPLVADLVDIITPATAVLEVQVRVSEGAFGAAAPGRQAYQLQGNVTTAREPDATNQS